MWDEHELPDSDLESVYGREAMHARTRAIFVRLLKNQDEGIARMDRLRVRLDAGLAESDRLLAKQSQALRAMDEAQREESAIALRLHGRVKAMVEQLTSWQGLSIADVIRKAITEEYFLEESRRRGEKILIETTSGTRFIVRFP